MQTHTLAVFHQAPADLNCAQSILDAYQVVTGIHKAELAEFKAFGGGRAPGNECGALYAACVCLPEKAEALRSEFKTRLGATTCKDLKRVLKVPCKECVLTAADLLARHHQAGASA